MTSFVPRGGLQSAGSEPARTQAAGPQSAGSEPARPQSAGPTHRVLAADLGRHTGERVSVQGWIHRKRELAAVSFVVLRDRSELAQVVVKDAATLGVLAGLGEESVVEVDGMVVANSAAPGGAEVVDPRITALSDPARTSPLELWRPTLPGSLPVQLDHAAIAWRHPAKRAIWDLAAVSTRSFRSTLDALGFTEVMTPKFVATSTESGANVFAVDYFGRPAYLAQSPQFYKQMLVGAFERVYEVGPVFRAEPHDTVRHLAEYVSLDVELGFIRDHRDVLAILREVLAGMVEGLRSEAAGAVDVLGIHLPAIPDEVPVVHFRDALALVGADSDEPDLEPAHERFLGEWALAEFGSDVLAVEGYPMVKRPFYTHPQPDDARWSNSFDLIFRGLELVTGGQRLHRHTDYLSALEARGESPAAYTAYLDTFAHGMPPHGGFAIGLERWLARLTGAANIREVTLFPRDLHRLTP